jgi:F-type H+-transporting ATPase subunit epsilon
MAETLKLEIVTPERLVVEDSAESVQIPGLDGYLGILPGHAPLITELAIGEISYRSGNRVQRIAVAWGFAEVLPDKVTILAETAERAETIDVERARRARERAESRMKKMEADYDESVKAFQRAENRLRIAGAGASSSDMAHIVP